MLNPIFPFLAQNTPGTPIAPWDELPRTQPTPTERPMGITDLQHGFQQYNQGQTDNTARNGLLLIVAVVAIMLLLLTMFQRWRARQTPDSDAKLARELSRLVPFPLGSRFLLWWVSHSTGANTATLMISSRAFTHAVETWAAKPTFSILRRWGRTRLTRLQHLLFDP